MRLATALFSLMVLLLAQLRDDPERGPAGGHALDVVEAVAERLGPVLPRGARQVRRDRDVVEPEQRMIGGRPVLGPGVQVRGRGPAGPPAPVVRRPPPRRG